MTPKRSTEEEDIRRKVVTLAVPFFAITLVSRYASSVPARITAWTAAALAGWFAPPQVQMWAVIVLFAIAAFGFAWWKHGAIGPDAQSATITTGVAALLLMLAGYTQYWYVEWFSNFL